MTGVYSVAEVIDDSNKRPEKKTIFCYLAYGFDKSQIKSLDKVGKMVSNNGGKYLKNLEDIPKYLKEFNV